MLTGAEIARMFDTGLKSPEGGHRHVIGGFSMSTPTAGVRRYKARERSNNPARPFRVLSPRRHGGSQKLTLAAFSKRSKGELAMTAKDSAMRRPIPHTLIKPNDWAALRDALVLALDAIGERPDEVDQLSLVHAVRHQRAALKITHRYFQAQ